MVIIIQDVIFGISAIVCVWLLRSSNIKLTITHKYPSAEAQPIHINSVAQKTEDVAKQQEDQNTLDEVLKTVQEVLGGTLNDED